MADDKPRKVGLRDALSAIDETFARLPGKRDGLPRWIKIVALTSLVAGAIGTGLLVVFLRREGASEERPPLLLPATENAAPSPRQVAPIPIDTSPRDVGKTSSLGDLTVAQAIELGIPSPDHSWDSEAYKVTKRVLGDFLAQNPNGQLPKRHNSDSGRIFERMVSVENLAPFRNTTIPLPARVMGALDLTDSVNALSKLYLGEMARVGRYQEELLFLWTLVVHLVALELSLFDAFVPTLDPKDPTYATRMGGVERARRGLGDMVYGTASMFGPDFPADEKTKTECLEQAGPDLARLARKLRGEQQRELIVKLRTIENGASSSRSKAVLEKVRKQVE